MFAKHCDPVSGDIQRFCHEELLPQLPVATPPYLGSHRDPDGTWWLFIEDVGREEYSARDPEQRRLAGQWVGRLHRHGAHLASAASLPGAGLERYLEHLRAACGLIQKHFANPALTEDDRDLLRAILRLLAQVEADWHRIERALEGTPTTFVHADLQPKNIRVVRDGAALSLSVFDWELAGRGLPAIDLAPANGHDLSSLVDLDAYLAEVAIEWPHLDAAAVQRQVAVGLVLRRLSAIEWASHSLKFERADYLSDPLSSLESYHRSLVRALAGLEEWSS